MAKIVTVLVIVTGMVTAVVLMTVVVMVVVVEVVSILQSKFSLNSTIARVHWTIESNYKTSK